MSAETQNVRRYPPVQPTCLAIHLTYQCPLLCNHCCFSSDMSKQQALSLQAVLDVIEDGTKLPGLEAVGFTGGDPFLHPDILEEGIAAAHKRNLVTRVVTSAYWATRVDKAISRLEPLVKAGLDEICLSYDDSHVAYIRETNIINAYTAAEHFGIRTTIYMSTDVGDRIQADYVREKLGTSEAENQRFLLINSQVTSTGRAAEMSSSETKALRAAREKTYRGPCPSMLRQPAVTPAGKILPCCGTIPFHQEMCIGDIAVDDINNAMIRAYDNDLFKWIAFEGPVSVLVQITEDTDEPIQACDLDGICHACDTLFSSQKYLELARKYLERKEASLRIQEMVFSEAGLYMPLAEAS